MYIECKKRWEKIKSRLKLEEQFANHPFVSGVVKKLFEICVKRKLL